MEKWLQPPKQEGFAEEIWKSLTAPPDTETDLLSDGEHYTSPQHSPIAWGTKRTADGEAKAWDKPVQFSPQAKVQSPPAAMPLEGRADGTDDEEIENKPRMYLNSCIPWLILDPCHLCISRSTSQIRTLQTAMFHISSYTNQRS